MTFDAIDEILLNKMFHVQIYPLLVCSYLVKLGLFLLMVSNQVLNGLMRVLYKVRSHIVYSAYVQIRTWR